MNHIRIQEFLVREMTNILWTWVISEIHEFLFKKLLRSFARSAHSALLFTWVLDVQISVRKIRMSPSLMFRFLFKEYHIVNRTFFKVIASKVPLSSAMNKMIKDSSINKNLMIAGCMMKLSHFLFLIFRKQQIIIYKLFFYRK